MVTGILSAYPDDGFFDDVLTSLYRIAREKVQSAVSANEWQLPQVHALNCLKDVFVDSQFGVRTEMQIGTFMELATDCLDCPVYVGHSL